MHRLWFRYGSAQYWPTWYAGVWAESAVLAQRDDAPARIARARPIARDNPVAAAMVERAAALAASDLAAVEQFAARFETLGCPYQEQRTRALATR